MKLLNVTMPFFALFASAAVFAEEAKPELSAEETENNFRFHAGVLYSPRVRVKGHFNGGVSRAQFRSLMPQRKLFPSGSGAKVPSSSGYANRQYADGFVNLDEGTTDSGSMIEGLTWNWGADDVAGQYSNGKMSFHTDAAEPVYSSSVSEGFNGGGNSGSTREEELGFEIGGEWIYGRKNGFQFGLGGGFRWTGSDDWNLSDGGHVSVSESVSTYRYKDVYDASGWDERALKHESYAGDMGGPGRLLGAVPESREKELVDRRSSQSSYSYSNDMKLRYNIWDLRLGPTLGYEITDDLLIQGGVYGLLGLVDYSLRASTSAGGPSSTSSQSHCTALFGLGFGIAAEYLFTDNIFLRASAEYDWWSDEVHTRAGAGSAEIALSDFTVTAGIGIEF